MSNQKMLQQLEIIFPKNIITAQVFFSTI